MIEKLLLLFRIPELRRKLILTVILLAVYRMGFWIPTRERQRIMQWTRKHLLGLEDLSAEELTTILDTAEVHDRYDRSDG